MLGAFDLKDNASMNTEIIYIFKFKKKVYAIIIIWKVIYEESKWI